MIKRLALVLSLACASIAVASLAAPAPAAAKCARVYLQPYVATPEGTVLPIDGGAILIGLDGRMGGGDDLDALPDTFTIKKGKKEIELTVEHLAPGFARLVPKEKPTAGKWKVVGVDEREPDARDKYPTATVTFGDGALPDPLPAPEVSAAVVDEERYGRGFLRVEVSATLAKEAPAGAVFVVSNWADAPDPSAGGAFAVSIEDGKLQAFRNRGRCSSSPTGERAPEGGSKANLRWVDAYGQVSAPSAAFEVTQGTEAVPH